MATCDSLLATGFLKNCDHPLSKAGIKKKWYINLEDIDKAKTTFDTTSEKTTISKLALVKGRNFYSVEGVKSQTSASYALSVTDYGNGYIHTDNYALQDRSTPHLIGLKQLARGARIVSVVERVDGGENGKAAFWVYGWGSGMQLTEHTGGTLDNNGNDLITLSTLEGEEEYAPPMIFLDTDYATTLGWLEANTYKGDNIDPRELGSIPIELTNGKKIYARTNFIKVRVGDKVQDDEGKPVPPDDYGIKDGGEVDINEDSIIVGLITVIKETFKVENIGATSNPNMILSRRGVDVDRATKATSKASANADEKPYTPGTYTLTGIMVDSTFEDLEDGDVEIEIETSDGISYVKKISGQPGAKKKG